VRSAVLAAGGLTIGLAAAAGTTRYLEAMLFGITPLDPATFAAVAAGFAAVALVASFVPARRAARVDPVQALRCEWRDEGVVLVFRGSGGRGFQQSIDLVRQSRPLREAVPDAAHPYDALVVDHDVGRPASDAEHLLNLPIAVPVLDPVHLVLGHEVADD